MGDIIELKPKDDDAPTSWTVEEALQGCLDDIRNKAIDTPSHVYIAMLIPTGDGEHRIAYVQSGMKNSFETIGVLKVHGDYHSGDWRSVD